MTLWSDGNPEALKIFSSHMFDLLCNLSEVTKVVLCNSMMRREGGNVMKAQHCGTFPYSISRKAYYP